MFTQLFNRLSITIATACSFLLLSSTSFGQCYVDILNTNADTLVVPCGTPAQLQIDPLPIFVESFDSNSPIGTFSSGTAFNNPCGSKSSPYLWMGDSTFAPRVYRIDSIDLACADQLCFQIRFAIQGDSTPCEGPDQIDEGVYLEYSNGGIWSLLFYFEPNPNGSLFAEYPGAGNYTAWSSHCFNLPNPSQGSPLYSFRWIQTSNSLNVFDHWGLDSIVITSTCASSTDIWSTGDTGQYTHTGPLFAPTEFSVTRIVQQGMLADTCFDTIVVAPTTLEVTTIPFFQLYCVDDSTNITAQVSGGSGIHEFAWSTGDTTQIVEDMPKGTYSVTVTDSTGCVASDTLNLNNLDSIQSWVDVQLPTCDTSNDGLARITALGTRFGVNQFLWMGTPVIPSDTMIRTGLDTGEYYFKLRSFDGCEVYDTIQITQSSSQPVIPFSDSVVFCESSSTLLDAGNAGSYFLWNTGDSTQTLLVDSSGLYSVTVTSAEGCISIDSTLAISEICLGNGELKLSGLTIYPNPVKSELNVVLDTKDALNEITIYNNNGSVIMQHFVTGKSSMVLDLSGVSEGVYILEIRTTSGLVQHTKVIKL